MEKEGSAIEGGSAGRDCILQGARQMEMTVHGTDKLKHGDPQVGEAGGDAGNDPAQPKGSTASGEYEGSGGEDKPASRAYSALGPISRNDSPPATRRVPLAGGESGAAAQIARGPRHFLRTCDA